MAHRNFPSIPGYYGSGDQGELATIILTYWIVGSNILQPVPSPWRKQTLSRQTCCSLEHGTVWLQKLQGCHWWHLSANQSWHLVQLSAKWVKVALNNSDVELMLSSSMLYEIHFWPFFRNYACRFVLWKKIVKLSWWPPRATPHSVAWIKASCCVTAALRSAACWSIISTVIAKKSCRIGT